MIDAIANIDKEKSIENQSIDQTSAGGIIRAIKSAADRTGVDFTYLLNKATQESSLNPTAKAKGSSATGLYQFTGQTWLRSIKEHGSKYGLDDAASHIRIDSDGVAHVDSVAAKHAILKLRNDPAISSEMAAELDKDNLATLKNNVGGKLGATDLYLAHFLGAGGASDFISAMRSNPNAKAANVVPDAAASNNGVFYSSSGDALSLKQVYQHFAQKFDSSKSATTLVASAAPTTSTRTPAAAYMATAAQSTNSTTGIAALSKIMPSTIAASFSVADNSIQAPGATTETGNSYTGGSYNAANPYANAVSAYSAGLATGGTRSTLSNTSLTAGNASVYATMVMAQMNAGNSAAISAYTAHGHDTSKKYDAYATANVG